MKRKKAKLIFPDGSEFQGYSFGYKKNISGEVVFNTGMIGYPETLTDPSYYGQILISTYPLVGNYGIPSTERENGLLKNFESEKIHIRGLIVSEYSEDYSHWEAEKSLGDWLVENEIPAITGIDTRAVTQKIRESGAVPGKILIEDLEDNIEFDDPNEENLSAKVCTTEVKEFQRGEKKIAIVDCGTKNNIIQGFLRRDISVTLVPYNYNFNNLDVDGIILSNGPGDPKLCKETIEFTKEAFGIGKPILGICLGSQIMALASGADTYKLKFGHRGLNQPVNESGTKKCLITSQNHGYAIDSETLPEDWREWFTNDNDQTNEGIIHISKPFFGAQFHPEASPGPDDTEFIFDMFLRAI